MLDDSTAGFSVGAGGPRLKLLFDTLTPFQGGRAGSSTTQPCGEGPSRQPEVAGGTHLVIPPNALPERMGLGPPTPRVGVRSIVIAMPVHIKVLSEVHFLEVQGL